MLTNEVTIKREFFLSCLFIEDMISNYIQEMFGETITKKVLGNEKLFSTFSEKIEFLMEVGNFSIIDNSKLSVFREIRRELLVSDDTESLEQVEKEIESNIKMELENFKNRLYGLPDSPKLVKAKTH